MPRIKKNKDIDIDLVPGPVPLGVNIKQKKPQHINYFFQTLFFVIISMMLSFSAFAVSGKYHLLLNSQISPEIGYIYLLVIGLGFALTLISSFSISGNILLCLVTLFFTILQFLDLFIVYDIGNIVAYMLSSFMAADTQQTIATYGNIGLSAILTLLFYKGIKFAGHSMIALVTGVFVLFLFIIIYVSPNTSKLEIYNNPKAVVQNSGGSENKNLIYIILNGASNLAYIQDRLKAIGNTDLENRYVNITTGFYGANGFRYYPNAYATRRNPYDAIASAMNMDLSYMDSDKAKDYIEDYVPDSYLSFGKNKSPSLYFSENKLFNLFHDSGYNITVYQNKDMDFCRGAGENLVGKCVTFYSAVGEVELSSLNDVVKAEVLLAHWIKSNNMLYPLINKARLRLYKLGVDLKSIPIIGIPMNDVSVLNQHRIVATAKKDIKEAKGKNLFVIYLPSPGGSYVQDEYCRVKDIYKWYSNYEYEWLRYNDNDRSKVVEAYLQQSLCSYGLLSNMLNNLRQEGVLSNSVVVVQGDGGSRIELNGLEYNKDLFYKDVENYKADYATAFGIYDPNYKASYIDYNICDTTGAVTSYLSGNLDSVCVPPEKFEGNVGVREYVAKWIYGQSFNLDKNIYGKEYASWQGEWDKEYRDMLSQVYLKVKNRNVEDVASENENVGQDKDTSDVTGLEKASSSIAVAVVGKPKPDKYGLIDKELSRLFFEKEMKQKEVSESKKTKNILKAVVSKKEGKSLSDIAVNKSDEKKLDKAIVKPNLKIEPEIGKDDAKSDGKDDVNLDANENDNSVNVKIEDVTVHPTSVNLDEKVLSKVKSIDDDSSITTTSEPLETKNADTNSLDEENNPVPSNNAETTSGDVSNAEVKTENINTLPSVNDKAQEEVSGVSVPIIHTVDAVVEKEDATSDINATDNVVENVKDSTADKSVDATNSNVKLEDVATGELSLADTSAKVDNKDAEVSKPDDATEDKIVNGNEANPEISDNVALSVNVKDKTSDVPLNNLE